MLSTPHLLVGAAIGSTVGGLPGAFAFGLLSHLLLDAVPHTDLDLLEEKHPKKIMPADYAAVTLDIVVGMVMVFYFAFSENHIPQHVIMGAFGGITPDLVGNVPFWSPMLTSVPVIKQFHQLHMFIGYKNDGSRKLLGVIMQFIAVVIAVVVLTRD